MLIVSEFTQSGDLRLAAYSYDQTEFQDLELFLTRFGMLSRWGPLPGDEHGRECRAYVIWKKLISTFESIIGGEFTETGKFKPKSGAGNEFACEEIVLGGRGGTCETISALDLAGARAACGLLAQTRGWFGGVPKPGPCPRKRGKLGADHAND